MKWTRAGFGNVMWPQDGRTRRRWSVPTDTEGLRTTERKGACGQPSLSRLGPGVRRRGEVDEDVLKTISSFLTTFRILTPIPPSPSKSPLLLVSKPLASDSLTISGSFPAYISKRTIVATIAAVWKSFFSRTASPHRKHSWFRKIKFRYTKQ